MTPAVALACACAVAVAAAMARAVAWARAVALAAAAARAVAVKLGVVVGAFVEPTVCPTCVVCLPMPGLLLACPRGMYITAREPATMSKASKMIMIEKQGRR